MPTVEDYRKLLEDRPEIRKYLQIRLNKYIPHVPTPKQLAASLCPWRELLYGGAAGGGKSDWLLSEGLRYADQPNYSGLILRRTYTQLNLKDSILNRAHQWLRGTDAVWSAQHNRYEFPLNGSLQFGYLQYFKDVYQYDSAQFHFIGFDEVTQFHEDQYRFLFSRLRRLKGSSIPIRARCAGNPGNVGHKWVKSRFITNPNSQRGFIKALLIDNPHIDTDEYREALAVLDPVTRAQREYGDWDASYEGRLMKRDWFSYIDSAPPDADEVRYWDLAATAGKGDYTAGVKMGALKGRFWIEDVKRARLGPADVESLVLRTARSDGQKCRVRIEQEPGSSGKIVIDHYTKLLAGFDVGGIRSDDKKHVRRRPFAAQAEAGNVMIVNADWNDDYVDELVSLPDDDSEPPEHDDQGDATAGAFNFLALNPRPTYGFSFIHKRDGEKESRR